MEKVTPYGPQGSKREQVETMFDRIAPRYDLLNRVFSLGIDQRWRKRVLRHLQEEPVEKLLDVATGTADLALVCARHAKHTTGADVSEGMLAHARTKITDAGLQDRIELIRTGAEELPFADATFDAVTVAFGVRNFDDLEKGLTEMHRVLRPNGRLFVLEFSKPRNPLLWTAFRFYFHRVMPFVGRTISRDKQAYTYLPRSVAAFPEGKEFEAILASCGYKGISSQRLSGGIATLYRAKR